MVAFFKYNNIENKIITLSYDNRIDEYDNVIHLL